MKQFLFLLAVLLIAIPVSAQVTPQQRVHITTSNPPTSCVPGHFYTNATTPTAWEGKSDGTCVAVGGGAVPTTITVANEASDATAFPLFVNSATGDLGPKTNAALTFNSTNGSLGATTFVGALTGTASGNLVSGGAAGTPSSITLTNGTGLPIAGITGLGTGVATWLATPSGANLASALTTALPVSKGGTNCTSATITCFNNITGFTAAGTTGTTSTNLVFSASPSITGTLGAAAATFSSTITQTSASATAFESGPNGSTNPVVRIVNSTTSQADGISITGLAAGSGVTFTALSSGSNAPINLAPKGTGSVVFPQGALGTPSIMMSGTTYGIAYIGGLMMVGAGAYAADFIPPDMYLGGTGSIGWTPSGAPGSAASDVSINRVSAGVMGIGTTTGGGTGGALKAATATFTTVAADTAATDTTLCLRSSDGLLLKGTGTLGICLGSSSLFVKQDVQSLTEGLDAIKALRPISFRYLPNHGYDSTKTYYGFGAEEFAPVLPVLSPKYEDGRPLSVDLLGLVPVLTKAIQELNLKSEMQQAEIMSLRALMKMNQEN